MSSEEDTLDRYWIAEIPARAVKTVLIRAANRKETEMKLRNSLEYSDDIEGQHVAYFITGYSRIIREDKKR